MHATIIQKVKDRNTFFNNRIEPDNSTIRFHRFCSDYVSCSRIFVQEF